MTKATRIILFIVGFLILVFAIWKLYTLVAYILIAFVISMMGQPLVNQLHRISIKNWVFPRWASSLVTLVFIWCLIILFFWFFVPLLANEFQYFSNLDLQSIFDGLHEPIQKIEELVEKFDLYGDEAFTVQGWATETITSLVGVDQITAFVRGIASALGNIFVAFVVISFTSFFFMKEAHLFEDSLVLIFPESQDSKVRKALHAISRFLKRYFIGISLQVTGIIILNTSGLSIVGLEFSHAVTIGLVSGVLNVIPYIGPLIGLFIGLVIGTTVSLPMDFQTEMVPLMIYIIIAMEFTQVIDNVVFQPLIFSKSVKAHPLEIFLVIIAAGIIGGVLGMILAVPSYTVLRVIARESITESKLVQKLTERM